MAMMHGNEAINKFFTNKSVRSVGNRLKQGVEDVWDVGSKIMSDMGPDVKGTQKITKAIESTFKNSQGNYDYGRMVGAGFVAGAGLRVATGGGLTRDKNGNQDIIGIPFI